MKKLFTALLFGTLCFSLAAAEKKAPDFCLKTPDGKNLSLSDYRGKVVVINFWATWCPPCRAEIPDFVKVYNELKDKGVVIIGVTLDNAPDKIRSMIRENAITYPVVIAEKNTASLFGGVSAVPTTFIVDKKGNIAAKRIGAMDKNTLENLVKKLL